MSDQEAFDDDGFGFALGSPSRYEARPEHPPSNVILELWNIFTDNVDPLTKIIHVPTMRPAMEKVASGAESIPRSLEALMFAIYSAAVMSLDDVECRRRFGISHRPLLSHYIAATQTTLARARFMGTTSLVVLQALVIHLLSIRGHHEPRAVWCLTGTAIRVAQGLGMERDGAALGLSPFESEIRRRIWWLLKTHDYRMAELAGFTKFRDLPLALEGTSFPTNVNDDELFPDMRSAPVAHENMTDMSFLTLKYDMMRYAANRMSKYLESGGPGNLLVRDYDIATSGEKSETDASIDAIESDVEMKYLRYCDPSQPLQLMISLMARSGINTIRFLSHHPRQWTKFQDVAVSEREWVWKLCVKLLEQHNTMHTNPALTPFKWQAAFVFPWQPLIHMLDVLRAEPLRSDADKTWQLVAATLLHNPAMVSDTSKAIHVAIGGLCLKAYAARESAMRRATGSFSEPLPDFIQRLRMHHEMAKAKRQARSAASQPQSTSDTAGRSSTADGAAGESTMASSAYGTNGHTQPTLSRPPALGRPSALGGPQEHSHVQAGALLQDDPFEFLDNFGSSHGGRLDDVMDWALDDMLASDQNVDLNAPYAITWDQWDTWLAESNTLLPVASR